MKNITVHVFITLGVIFLLLVVAGVYLFVADPFGFKQSMSPTQSSSAPVSGSSSGFELSSAQRDALVSMGVDPAMVPASISAEQEGCFVGALGEARVGEIKAGAVPNAIEFVKAKSCI